MDNNVLTIYADDIELAQNSCSSISDSDTRNRAVANVLAVMLAERFFNSINYQTDLSTGLHNIPNVVENLDIADIYLNRAVGHYLQKQGLYVIPNIRWGDERTYRKDYLGEKVAFQGVDKHSIVSVGTYGQIKTAESKRYFAEGLEEMIKELEPKVVLVYGSMPDRIFADYKNETKFIQYPDWTTRMKRK